MPPIGAMALRCAIFGIVAVHLAGCTRSPDPDAADTARQSAAMAKVEAIQARSDAALLARQAAEARRRAARYRVIEGR